jgi:uncharacterized OB-fold protein
MCPRCGSLEWDVQEASGRGTVHSWIVSRHPTEPDRAPRVVVLVDLEEGVRLVSNLRDVDVSDVRNDMAVEVMFETVNDAVLPQFRPADESRLVHESRSADQFRPVNEVASAAPFEAGA